MRRLKKDKELYAVASLEDVGNDADKVQLAFAERFPNVDNNSLHQSLENGFYEVVIKDNDAIDYTLTCFIDIHPEKDDEGMLNCLCPIYYPRTGYPLGENETQDCFLPGFIYISQLDPNHIIVMDMYKREDQSVIQVNTTSDCFYYFYKLDI